VGLTVGYPHICACGTTLTSTENVNVTKPPARLGGYGRISSICRTRRCRRRAHLTDGSVPSVSKKKATVTAIPSRLMCADAVGAPHRDPYTASWRDPAHFVLRADPVDGVIIGQPPQVAGSGTSDGDDLAKNASDPPAFFRRRACRLSPRAGAQWLTRRYSCRPTAR